MKLQADLREFVALLTAKGVEFVVIGGHAVAYHGYPRFTGDIDLLVRPHQRNAARVLEALAEFGFGDVGLAVDDLTTPDHVVQLGRPPNRIDIVTSITGVDFDTVWQGRVATTLDGLPVHIIGLSELLTNKRATGRLKDLADVEEIERVSTTPDDTD